MLNKWLKHEQTLIKLSRPCYEITKISCDQNGVNLDGAQKRRSGLGWLHLHGLILAYEQTPLFRFHSSSESQSYLFLVFLQKIENSIIIIHWLCFSESDRPYLLFYIIIMYASIISYVSIKQCYVREEINIWNYSTLNKILDFHSWAVYDKSHRVHY